MIAISDFHHISAFEILKNPYYPLWWNKGRYKDLCNRTEIPSKDTMIAKIKVPAKIRRTGIVNREDPYPSITRRWLKSRRHGFPMLPNGFVTMNALQDGVCRGLNPNKFLFLFIFHRDWFYHGNFNMKRDPSDMYSTIWRNIHSGIANPLQELLTRLPYRINIGSL